VRRVAGGDLSRNFPVERQDEIGELAESFNEMVKKLRERETLEKRLYEAEHLSRVGQLASGIAHEIRNPLNYISLAIDHLKSEFMPVCTERSAELGELADKIKEEVRRVNHMVLSFMSYGRPLKLRRSRVAYRELLDKALPMLGDRFAEQHIELHVEIEPELPLLFIDQELMRNCLVNFLGNAADALPNGGTITVGAQMDHERAMARLTFADNGSGISEEDLPKIFQPYFTTKDAGIGLGLAITERIIREHRGELQVTSSSAGTVFTVLLPLDDKETPA